MRLFKETIPYFPIAHNTLCLRPKFCINYCFQILLGGLHISKTIVYAKFGGQTKCIMGNWKIENIFAYKHELRGSLTSREYLSTAPKGPGQGHLIEESP